MDQLVSDLVLLLERDLREEFEERAGLMEFDGGMTREHAECLAMLDVISRHPAVLCGVIVVEVEVEGSRKWLLTTDWSRARRVAKSCDGAAQFVDLAEVVDERFGGAAVLVPVP